jgi:hypothetical protein
VAAVAVEEAILPAVHVVARNPGLEGALVVVAGAGALRVFSVDQAVAVVVLAVRALIVVSLTVDTVAVAACASAVAATVVARAASAVASAATVFASAVAASAIVTSVSSAAGARGVPGAIAARSVRLTGRERKQSRNHPCLA